MQRETSVRLSYNVLEWCVKTVGKRQCNNADQNHFAFVLLSVTYITQTCPPSCIVQVRPALIPRDKGASKNKHFIHSKFNSLPLHKGDFLCIPLDALSLLGKDHNLAPLSSVKAKTVDLPKETLPILPIPNLRKGKGRGGKC